MEFGEFELPAHGLPIPEMILDDKFEIGWEPTPDMPASHRQILHHVLHMGMRKFMVERGLVESVSIPHQRINLDWVEEELVGKTRCSVMGHFAADNMVSSIASIREQAYHLPSGMVSEARGATWIFTGPGIPGSRRVVLAWVEHRGVHLPRCVLARKRDLRICISAFFEEEIAETVRKRKSYFYLTQALSPSVEMEHMAASLLEVEERTGPEPKLEHIARGLGEEHKMLVLRVAFMRAISSSWSGKALCEATLVGPMEYIALRMIRSVMSRDREGALYKSGFIDTLLMMYGLSPST
jgi:hypothetical protein